MESEQEQLRRQQYCAFLRAASIAFEDTRLPLPATPSIYLHCWGSDDKTKAALADIARAFGKTEKDYSGDALFLRRHFDGGFDIVAMTDRALVCKRVPTGKKRVIPARPAEPEREEDEYDWDCGEGSPLLKSLQVEGDVK